MKRASMFVVFSIVACKRDPNDHSCSATSIKLDEAMSTATLTDCGDKKTRAVTCTEQDDHHMCTCSVDGKPEKTFKATGNFVTDEQAMDDAVRTCGY